MRPPRVLAIDWSGDRRAPQRRIWVAEAREGQLVALTGGLDREAAVAFVVAAGDVVAGFDFAFSFPAWFVREQGCATVDALWSRVARDGEAWLAACAPPFWGRPGRARPARGTGEPELRVSEATLGAGPGAGGSAGAGAGDTAGADGSAGAGVGGTTAFRPKSVFQIGGAGAVGTGSIRGMPLLRVLRGAGFALWPWDAARAPMALEIYPRALTGPVVKRSAEAREAYLAHDPRVPPALLAIAVASEDAFDAAVSALELAARLPELLALPAARDPVTRLEGAIWRPAGR